MLSLPPHALAIATQFLTRLPLRLSSAPTPRELARSLYWYPLVGAGIGLLLLLLYLLLAEAPAPMRAGLLLLALVAITGGLHLDGVADCADAWMGGQGDRERTLALLKDPRAGAMAVIGVASLLILQACALASLDAAQAPAALLVAPLLGRAAVLLLVATTPYCRERGLGSALAEGRSPALLIAIAVIAASVAPLMAVAGASLSAGVIAVVVAALSFWRWRRSLMQRLGGFTGDGAGTLVELVQTVVLVVYALASMP